MASRVYRHQHSGGRKSKKWYIEYTSHDGKIKRRPAYRSKALSVRMLAEVIEREERIKAGVLDATEGLPASPVGELIARWRAYTIGKGTTERHANSYRRQVEDVCRACGFFDAKSLNGARAQDYLDGLIAKGRANRTYQYYRSSLLAFGNWLVKKEKLLSSNPFSTIDIRDPEQNRKIVRRVLSESEFRQFLESTRKGKEHRNLSGIDRYFLYLVAAYSGLRLGAMVRLTPGRFDLKAGTVSSSVRMQKNKKAHCVPLPADVVAKLRRWMKGRPCGELLWPDVNDRRGARMVKYDLEAAGLTFKDESGAQFDFHSLRHQYGTALARSGASPIEVQHLLDHSSPALSARYFRHLKTDELRRPVGRLPKL